MNTGRRGSAATAHVTQEGSDALSPYCLVQVSDLITRIAIGYEIAAQLLIMANDNIKRLHSEAGFAALCGVSPGPESSGKIQRYKLNRSGDRAIHIIAVGRLRLVPAPQAYVVKRLPQGSCQIASTCLA